MKRFLVGTSFLALTLGLLAQAPKYSNEFLAIGVGARSLGMANAQTAISKPGLPPRQAITRSG